MFPPRRPDSYGARIQRLIITADPAAAKDRYEEKLLEAKVICEPTDAGTANLMGLDLPADQANRAMRRINQKAKKLKARGDRRPIDLIRAQLFLDLLTGTHQQEKTTGTDRAQINLHADLSTILGWDENPGEIPGWGPVISDVARKIVADQEDAEWNLPITHHQQLIDLIITRKRPNREQQRIVQALTHRPDPTHPTTPTHPDQEDRGWPLPDGLSNRHDQGDRRQY